LPHVYPADTRLTNADAKQVKLEAELPVQAGKAKE
jgi:hypothetical protein